MRSLLRRAEYARLGKLSLEGKILDVGGSVSSGYQELIGGTHTFVTANIDAASGADIVFDAEEAWPVEEGSYDAVLFINLLEHLYRYEVAVREAHKALRPGGQVIGVVPFMYNVHGSPD